MCTPSGHDRVASAIRRSAFLAGGAAALGCFLLPRPASAAEDYTLWLQRMDTGETAAVPFTIDGTALYKPGYYALCALLRDNHVDPRVGDVQMNVRLIETLWAIQRYLVKAGVREPIIVHSGYRTPETNAHTEGAARNSLHMYGEACDFDVPGVAIADLAAIAWACPSTGGVGYYPDGWVHVDAGPRRWWEG